MPSDGSMRPSDSGANLHRACQHLTQPHTVRHSTSQQHESKVSKLLKGVTVWTSTQHSLMLGKQRPPRSPQLHTCGDTCPQSSATHHLCHATQPYPSLPAHPQAQIAGAAAPSQTRNTARKAVPFA